MTQVSEAEVDRILTDLESDVEATRRGAVGAAVRLGDRAVRAIPLLQRMADQDPVPEVRYHARKGLHVLALEAHMRSQPPATAPAQPQAPGPKSAKITQLLAEESLPVVAQKLNSSNPNVRASALRATAIKQDKRLIPVLLARMGPTNEPDAELRAIQARVLAVLGGKEQLKNLATYLDDPEPDVRVNAVDVLAQLRDVMAFPFIVRSLQDKDPRPKQHAATALSKVGPVNILKICGLMAQNEQAWMRDAAVYCLALTKLPDGVPLLEKALKDAEEPVRSKARLGLQRLAEQGLATAKAALARAEAAPAAKESEEQKRAEPVVESRPAEDIASPEPAKRRVATKQLIALDGALDESHLPRILDRLRAETDVPVMVNLLTALGRIKKADVVPVLAPQYLQHPEETVRAAVIDTLASIGSPEALEPVAAMVSDASPVVIGRALVALRAEPGVDVLAELTKMAEHADARFRTTAVYVITELGDAKFVPLVQKLTADSDSSVASLAQDAADILAPVLEKKPAPPAKNPNTGALSRPNVGRSAEVTAPRTRPANIGAAPEGSETSTTGALKAPSRSALRAGSKPAVKPSGPTSVPGAPAVTPAPAGGPGGGLKAAAGLQAAGGLAWLIVAAWHLSGATISGAQIGLAAVSMGAGLGGLFVGYALMRVEPWAFKPGVVVCGVHAFFGLAQLMLGPPLLVVLGLLGIAAGALLLKERACFGA